jgi:hypothetical protein
LALKLIGELFLTGIEIDFFYGIAKGRILATLGLITIGFFIASFKSD